MTDRTQFGAAVRSRSWEWLFALRKRLNVDLQMVDDGQLPLLAAGAAATVPLDALLSDSAPGIRVAITTALRTRSPQAASVDRLQTVIVPITVEGAVGGALIVGRRTPESQAPERVRGELELVGFWLANAIEAHLQSPPAAQGDLDRLSSLFRLLADAPAHKSDRDIVAVFIETLAVWHDLEAYGYVETTRDEFARELALPGSDPARTPGVIPRASLPEGSQVSRLSKSDMDRLGFPGGEDVVIARVSEEAGSWLIVIAGSITTDDLPRVSLYISMLDQAVARAAQATSAHVLATLSSHLLGDTDNPEEHARQALTHVQRALGLSAAAFTVTTRTGAPLLHAGAAFTASDLAGGSDDGKVVVIRRDPQQYAMAFVGQWPAGHRVTQQENHVAHAAADLLEAWARRLTRQLPRQAPERRASGRRFDAVLERFARQSVDSGVPVTAAVLSFADAVAKPDVTQARVIRLREHLRGGDLVGRLGDSEVGVLFHDAASRDARALRDRIHRVLEGDGVPLNQVSIGIASRNPGESTADSLTEEARQRAAQQTGDR
jgi:hypothetical protein